MADLSSSCKKASSFGLWDAVFWLNALISPKQLLEYKISFILPWWFRLQRRSHQRKWKWKWCKEAYRKSENESKYQQLVLAIWWKRTSKRHWATLSERLACVSPFYFFWSPFHPFWRPVSYTVLFWVFVGLVWFVGAVLPLKTSLPTNYNLLHTTQRNGKHYRQRGRPSQHVLGKGCKSK